jgi:hypothetical protein
VNESIKFLDGFKPVDVLGRVKDAGHFLVDFVINRHEIVPTPNTGAAVMLDEHLE